MIQTVHQFQPVLLFGDAISNQLISIHKLLRGDRLQSEIFAEYPHPSFEKPAFHFREYAKYATEDSLLLLHYSIGNSAEVMDWLERVPGRKILLYHNITPADYFINVNEHYREAAWRGREQLRDLLPLTEAAWGDSAYNCRELEEAGWRHTRALPIIFDPRFYQVTPDRRTVTRLREAPGPNLLFVGRVAPNKKLEDLILTHYYLRKYVAPTAELHLVGKYEHLEPYRGYLEELVQELGCDGVRFHGMVSREELVAFYQEADLFLCMSEHEGFCVPLIESMYYDLPIVAYNATAVPETLGGAGVLVHEKNFEAIAELIGLLLEEREWQERIVAAQRERLKAFLPEQVGAQLRCYLQELA